MTRDPGENFEDEVAPSGKPHNLEHGLLRRKRNKNKSSMECVAHDGAVLESKCKLQIEM